MTVNELQKCLIKEIEQITKEMSFLDCERNPASMKGYSQAIPIFSVFRETDSIDKEPLGEDSLFPYFVVRADSVEYQADDKDQALKKALNLTARQARERLAQKAQETYAVKKTSFRKEIKIRSATTNRMSASLLASGRAKELLDFKVSPATVQKGNKRPKITKGKVLKRSPMKKLQIGELKAFVVRFSNGHKAVAQRRSKQRYPIKNLLSPSVPVMLGNARRVYGIVEPYIQDDLERNLEHFVSMALEGKN